MYDFDFLDDEKLIEVFDDIFIKNGNDEKITTVALTSKRILFLDYVRNDGLNDLRIMNKFNMMSFKKVYYVINLDEISSICKDDYYRVLLKDGMFFEFNNDVLFQLLVEYK
jgi:hypothetical protein